MTIEEALAQLSALGNETVRAHYIKNGANQEQFGVRLGDIRTLAKKIRTNHEFGMALWETQIIDAQLLAILLMRPAELSEDQVDGMVRSVTFMQIADWFGSYIVKKHPGKETLRQRWMKSDDPLAARAGWSLTAERVEKQPDGLDLSALLDRIEAQMADAAEAAKWTMNFALAAIGINHPDHRERAIAIGESLGVYRDYPVSKGCTSPFAPIWINEIVSRQA